MPTFRYPNCPCCGCCGFSEATIPPLVYVTFHTGTDCTNFDGYTIGLCPAFGLFPDGRPTWAAADQTAIDTCLIPVTCLIPDFNILQLTYIAIHCNAAGAWTITAISDYGQGVLRCSDLGTTVPLNVISCSPFMATFNDMVVPCHPECVPSCFLGVTLSGVVTE